MKDKDLAVPENITKKKRTMGTSHFENTDPDEELNEISGYCSYCNQTKPNGEMLYDHKNYSHPVCDYCLENKSEHDADMDAQDSKWGKNKV